MPPGLLSKALEVKNWVKAGGVASFLSGLKVFNEEAAAREDERQDEKQNLRDKAKATANYIVWYHLDIEERESKTTNRCEFEQMIKAAKPIMKKKLRKRGNFLARLLTSTPSPELAEIYVREEIVKKMQDRRIKMLDGDTMFEKMDPDCDKKASGLFGWLCPVPVCPVPLTVRGSFGGIPPRQSPPKRTRRSPESSSSGSGAVPKNRHRPSSARGSWSRSRRLSSASHCCPSSETVTS